MASMCNDPDMVVSEISVLTLSITVNSWTSLGTRCRGRTTLFDRSGKGSPTRICIKAYSGAVGKQIASKLCELTTEEASRQWRFKDDVDAMVDKMQDLEALLHDADDRLRRGGRDGEVVGRWLTKFKSVTYDVKDVLDDLDATELLKKSQPKGSSDKHIIRGAIVDNPIYLSDDEGRLPGVKTMR